MNASPAILHSARFRKNVIHWSRPYPIHSLQHDLPGTRDDDANLYIVVRRHARRDKVIYVGMTYQQTVSKRFLKHDIHQKLYLDRVDDEVFVMTGRLETPRSRAEVVGVEALLIYRLDPRYNCQGRREHQPNSLVVVNKNAGRLLQKTYAGSRAASLRFRFWGGMKRAAAA